MKRLSLALMLACIAMSLASLSNQDFVIGAYSQFQLMHAPQPELVFDSLGVYLEKAGYNTVLYSMYDGDVEQGKLAKALAALAGHKLNSVIDDWIWKENGPVGVTTMAYGNYLKMEAEYRLNYQGDKFIPDRLPGEDFSGNVHNYVFRHDTGMRNDSPAKAYSHGFAWICDAKAGHPSGMMLSEPRFRWKPNDRADSRTIGYDFKFLPSATGNKLYLRVAMSFRDAAPGAKVASIKLKVMDIDKLNDRLWEYGRYPEDSYIELPLIPVKPMLYDTTIYNNAYPDVAKDPLTGFHIFEYYAEFPRQGSQFYKSTMKGEYFYHLNPQVYWHGEGQLSLDYLEFEDELHKALGDPGHAMQKRLRDRLEQISKVPGSEHISYFYSKDEPFQGQFSAYTKMESILGSLGKRLIAATHMDNPNFTKPDGLPNYSHYAHFWEAANPGTIMLDAYPLSEWGSGKASLIKWDGNLKSAQFVQNRIDRVLMKHYHYLAATRRDDPRHSDTQLFFIPQTFGEKYDGSEWRFFMPPRSMLRCLQFLPLCYAADGIIDFAIASNPDKTFPAAGRQYRRVTPLNHGQAYANIKLNTGINAYQHLSEANAKIKVYGPLLRKLSWLEADSLMVNGSHSSIDIKRLGLKSLDVRAQGKGSYEGYVQCGYYMDKNNLPSYMLVNRRSVYKKDGSPDVVPLEVDNYFVDATPQTVRFRFADKQFRVMIDPFTGKTYYSAKGSIEVSLDAGDGILLQTVSAIPPKLKGERSFHDQQIIGNKLTLYKKARLTSQPESRLHFADNSTVVLKKGAELDLQGNTTFGKGVKIIVKKGAKFTYDKGNTLLAPDTRIEYQKSNWFMRLFGK